MSYDPFGDDPDADIFRDDDDEIIEEVKATADIESTSRHKHTVDGTECPTCGFTHPTFLQEELGPEALEAVMTVLDSLPSEFVASILESDGGDKRKLRPQAEMLSTFINYTERMDGNNKNGPMMLAIVEHLDEQTGGRISAKWRIYDAERRLVISHRILKSTNIALDDALSSEASKPGYISLLELTVDFAQERLEVCKQRYVEAAAVINYEPIESILEHGLYPNDEDRETQQMIAEDLYEQLVVQ